MPPPDEGRQPCLPLPRRLLLLVRDAHDALAKQRHLQQLSLGHLDGEHIALGVELALGLAAGLGDLPLFAAADEAEAVDPLRERLEALNPDLLSPREALDALYALKRIADEQER